MNIFFYALDLYFKSSKETMILSPTSTNSGTSTLAPQSKTADL